MTRPAATVGAYDEPPSSAPGVEQDERAARHRQAALEAVDELDRRDQAIVNALLAIEARVDELTCYVAQLQ